LAAQFWLPSGWASPAPHLDEVAVARQSRHPSTGAPPLADRAYVHLEFAKAEAMLRAARAFFYETTDSAWQNPDRGDALSTDQKALIRLAASHAAHTAAEATRIAYKLSGTAGIFTRHPLSRYLRDAMVVPQHAFLNEGTIESAGRALMTGDGPLGFT